MRAGTVWGWRALLMVIVVAALAGLPGMSQHLDEWRAEAPVEDSSERSANDGLLNDDSSPSGSEESESESEQGEGFSSDESQDEPEAGAASAEDSPPQESETAEGGGAESGDDSTGESAMTSNDGTLGGSIDAGWVLPATRIVVLSIAAVFAVGAITTLLGATLASEGVRMGLMLALAGPVLAMLARNEDGTFTRGRVLGYVEAHPGIHFSALRDALGLANGGTAHHLYILEREGKVLSWVDGRRRRYASSGVDPKRLKDLEQPVTGMQQAILQILVDADKLGMTSVQMTAQLETSRQLMSYHLKRLQERELVDSEGRGRRRTYHLREAGRTLLSATAHL